MKNLKKIYLLSFAILTFSMDLNGETTHDFDKYKDEYGWYDFRTCELNLTIDSVFILYKAQFDLGNDDKMKLIYFESDFSDTLGWENDSVLRENGIDSLMVHYRYKQYYKDYAVENADFTVQAEQGIVQGIQGKIKPGLNINVANPISEDIALSKALDFVQSQLYAWDDSTYVNGLIGISNDSAATYFPKGQLLIGRKHGAAYDSSIYAFVWSFDIFSLNPFQHINVYVNALNGEIFDSFDPTESMYCRIGTVQTSYNGTHNFETKTCTFCTNWYLSDCRGSNSANGISTLLNGSGPTDSDNNWSSVSERPATTSHWIGGVSWDFFKSTYGRNGADNNSGTVTINAISSITGSYYHPLNNTLEIGVSPITSNPLSAIDIVGHEFTHGVTHHSSDLGHYGESGSLNESFSDIFGTMIQRFGVNIINWTLGEDAWLIRDMSDPTLHSQPAIYHGNNWDYSINGDVHINCGVQNKWFYLLSVGGNFNGIQVTGIGIDKAARIAYKNLTQYLFSSANYNDARAGSIMAANSLFGCSSNELAQVKKAWAAVGVGNSTANSFCIFPDHFPTTLCQSDFNCYNSGAVQASFSVHTVPSGATYTWSIPSGWIATTNGNTADIWFFNSMNTSGISVTAHLGSQSVTYSGTVSWNPHCQLYGWPCHLLKLKRDILDNNTFDNSNPKFFPNPTSNSITVQFNESDLRGTVEIENNLGQKLLEYKIIDSIQSIDISSLNNGIYFIVLRSDNSLKTGKLVLNK